MNQGLFFTGIFIGTLMFIVSVFIWFKMNIFKAAKDVLFFGSKSKWKIDNSMMNKTMPLKKTRSGSLAYLKANKLASVAVDSGKTDQSDNRVYNNIDSIKEPDKEFDKLEPYKTTLLDKAETAETTLLTQFVQDENVRLDNTVENEGFTVVEEINLTEGQ